MSATVRSVALRVACLLAAGTVPAAAAVLPGPAVVGGAPVLRTLTVTADGKVERAPDLAELSGGVVTQAVTAAAALADNARAMTAVVAAVRKAGIADRDIQTSGLSLQPQYKYGNNQAPVLTGYQATNTVTLGVRKLAETGRLIDTLVAVGANQIGGPTFRLDAADAALDEARTAAVARARARAELYARAAGVRLRGLLSLSEGGGETVPRPIMLRTMAMKSADAAPESPVAPGEVALSVTVTMVFEIE